MTWELITTIANSMFQVFGGGVLAVIILCGFLIFILLAVRTPKLAVLMILIPVVTAAATLPTQYFEVERWIAVMIWAMLGIFMAGVFWVWMQ